MPSASHAPVVRLEGCDPFATLSIGGDPAGRGQGAGSVVMLGHVVLDGALADVGVVYSLRRPQACSDE